MDLNNKLAFDNWTNLDLDYKQRHLKLEIITARKLDESYIERIVNVLQNKYNFVADPIVNQIDSRVIGGIKVVFDTKVIDGTYRGRLNDLKAKFNE